MDWSCLETSFNTVHWIPASFWKIDNTNINGDFKRVDKKNNCEYAFAEENNSIL